MPGRCQWSRGIPPIGLQRRFDTRRASFKSVKIVHRDWKKAIIVRGNKSDHVARRRTRE
jgi:hypothetical protein